jgi:protein-S-isoprenylcysteine O-methyltransferase Ste14
MNASAVLFRYRMAINTVLVILGFWAPWIDYLGIGRRISLLEWSALEISRLGMLRFTVAAPAVIVVAALIAAIGAFFRVWGTAYLGPGIVQHAQMKAGSVLADGPYRYVRNPLYLGLWCMVLALAFIMPPTGALFTVVAITIFVLTLISGEEAFLTAQLGEPYRAYLSAVPRLFPRFRTSLLPTGRKPRWLRALLAEPIPIGVFLALAVFSWTYNNQLMIRIILVSLGVSLITRAFLSGTPQSSLDPEEVRTTTNLSS